jgi:hypothetical protein
VEKAKKEIKTRGARSVKTKQIGLASRIGILIFILLCLYLLSKTGGNGQDWYPGKPFHER